MRLQSEQGEIEMLMEQKLDKPKKTWQCENPTIMRERLRGF